MIVQQPGCTSGGLAPSSSRSSSSSSSSSSSRSGDFGAKGRCWGEAGAVDAVKKLVVFSLLSSQVLFLPITLPGGAPPLPALAVESPLSVAASSTSTSSSSASLPAGVVFQGRVVVDNGITASSSPDAALYITARPSNSGKFKAPAFAAARFAAPTFPFDFSLTQDQLTPEGAAAPKDWEAADLVVSARLDTDGIASTRDPEDLIGRGAVYKFGKDASQSAQWSRADIKLGGRGFGGKAITAKQPQQQQQPAK